MTDFLGLLGRPELGPEREPARLVPAAYLHIHWSDDVESDAGPIEETLADDLLVALFADADFWRPYAQRPLRAIKRLDGQMMVGGIVQ